MPSTLGSMTPSITESTKPDLQPRRRPMRKRSARCSRPSMHWRSDLQRTLRRIVDYPNLWGFTRELYQHPGVAGTTNFEHIKKHYYQSHESINPTRIVPLGPDLDFRAPHGRERLASSS